MLNALKKLYELGQSPWYDNIDRRLINSGRLKKFIEDGIVGLTSNPTIFQNAVAASDVYDGEIKRLLKEGKTAKEIYDEVTTSDVRNAADLLRDIYIKTRLIDGYVSIEVYPEYAHDAGSTVKYAREIYKKVDRRNIMIKVPGTYEGYAAIRRLISEGINVNVTLLFSVEHYEQAALAYIDGLKERLKQRKSVEDVISVASVFVSRIDTKLDNVFEEKKEDSLKGRVAIANTKMIYQRFKGLFGDKNFGALKDKGGRIQRPLWASTSTKNPAYSDIKYVEELVGRDTINTMPQNTMEAYLDHGRPRLTIEDDLDDARLVLKRLKSFDIDISRVCQTIQDEGVLAFQDSFDKLITTIQK